MALVLHVLPLALQPTPPRPHPVLRRSASTWTQADRSLPHAYPDRIAALLLRRDRALSSSELGEHVAAADAFAAELAAMGVLLSDTHRVWRTQPPAPSGWVRSDLGDAAAVDAAWVDGLLVRRNAACAAGDYASANLSNPNPNPNPSPNPSPYPSPNPSPYPNPNHANQKP